MLAAGVARGESALRFLGNDRGRANRRPGYRSGSDGAALADSEPAARTTVRTQLSITVPLQPPPLPALRLRLYRSLDSIHARAAALQFQLLAIFLVTSRSPPVSPLFSCIHSHAKPPVCAPTPNACWIHRFPSNSCPPATMTWERWPNPSAAPSPASAGCSKV